MRVVFNSGDEAVVAKVSSRYSLEIATTDESEIEKFKALLTRKNLVKFDLVDESGNVTDHGEYMGLTDISVNEEFGSTNFQLSKLDADAIRVLELEDELEVQAEAIQELAELISE